MRLSPEMSYISDVLNNKLKKLSSKGQQDEIITNKIFSLFYKYMEKVWKNPSLYLYPYVKQVKALTIIDDMINKTHQNNIKNISETFDCFFN